MQATGGDSTSPSITFDGRFVAFASAATDLIGSDGNVAVDIFYEKVLTDPQLKSFMTGSLWHDKKTSRKRF